MNYTKQIVTFPSSDNKNTITGYIYTPVSGKIKGVLQISHGMVDHIERYEALAEALCKRGYAVAGNDHLGHGRSAAKDDDLGFFADKDGIDLILRDLHAMNRHLRERFPGITPVMMGHSMGSFLSRLYVVKYPHSICGHIIHGTGGPMGAALPLGKFVASVIALFSGKRYRSSALAKLAFMGYNSKFPKSEGKNAWLTRELSLVDGRDSDKFTSFTFTVSAYKDLFNMVGKSNSGKWFSSYPKNLATYVVSGDMDPVGKYGKGPKYVYKNLLISGVNDISLKLYEGARHELFNESCRDEVFNDMAEWLDKVFQ